MLYVPKRIINYIRIPQNGRQAQNRFQGYSTTVARRGRRCKISSGMWLLLVFFILFYRKEITIESDKHPWHMSIHRGCVNEICSFAAFARLYGNRATKLQILTNQPLFSKYMLFKMGGAYFQRRTTSAKRIHSIHINYTW